MSIKEFLSTYCNSDLLKYKAYTIDLMEKVEKHLTMQCVAFPTRVGAAHRIISAALEIYDKSLPDYAFLQKMEKEIRGLQVKA